MTYKQRKFLIDVDDNPYDILHQSHSPSVAATCKAKGWVKQSVTGRWVITPLGQTALGDSE